jgi:hypothetical protein
MSTSFPERYADLTSAGSWAKGLKVTSVRTLESEVPRRMRACSAVESSACSARIRQEPSSFAQAMSAARRVSSSPCQNGAAGCSWLAPKSVHRLLPLSSCVRDSARGQTKISGSCRSFPAFAASASSGDHAGLSSSSVLERLCGLPLTSLPSLERM